MARKTNGTGQGGKSFQDRVLAADVRTLSLKEIQYILKNFGFTSKDKDVDKPTKANKKLYDGVVLNLSKTILPRLTEHSGPDGDPIKFSQIEVVFK